MVRTAHDDRESVARRIFGEIFVGDRLVLTKPVRRREFFEGGGQLAIDLSPSFLQVGS